MPLNPFFSIGSVHLMKKWHVAVVVLSLVVVATGVGVWVTYVDFLSALKHETNRWAVIEDVNGDRMAVEPSSNTVWSTLVELHQNGTSMWVGGIVERYANKWGFRFKPDTVTVAQFTAEALQATIRHISADFDYWLGLGWAYVGSRVVEAHSQP